MANAPSEEVQTVMMLTEPEWMTLRSIVCEFAASVGEMTDDEAAIVDRIIEATDA